MIINVYVIFLNFQSKTFLSRAAGYSTLFMDECKAQTQVFVCFTNNFRSNFMAIIRRVTYEVYQRLNPAVPHHSGCRQTSRNANPLILSA
jgi:hypothetical protein